MFRNRERLVRFSPTAALSVLVTLIGLATPAAQPDAQQALDSLSDEPKQSVVVPGDFVENAYEMKKEWGYINHDPEGFARAIEQAKKIAEFVEPGAGEESLTDGPAPFAWQEIGAGVYRGTTADVHYAGRVTSARYAFDVEQSREVLFLGTVGGGLWKAVGLGLFAIWQPVSDSLDGSPSVGDFVINPGDPTQILIGTGDAFRYDGTGLYRSDDAGATWSRMSMFPRPRHFYHIESDVDDPSRVVFATSSGLYLSEDFGLTSTRVWSGARVTDIVQDPGNSQRWLATGEGVPVLESVDGANSFDPIGGHGGLGLGNGIDRAEIAMSAADPSYVYILASGATQCSLAPFGGFTGTECETDAECLDDSRCEVSGTLTETPCQDDGDCVGMDGTCVIASCDAIDSGALWGVYRSDDGGFSYEAIDAVDNISGNQGFHAIALEVDPTDPDRVLAGMVGIQYTQNGTAVGPPGTVQPVLWNRTLRGDNCDSDGDGTFDLPNTENCNFPETHPDYTSFVFAPPSISPDQSTVVITNDGGVYLYDKNTHTVQADRNMLGLTISQVMHPYGSMAAYYDDPDRMYAGLQDNGSIIINKAAANPLLHRFGGDGGNMSVSPHDPDLVAFGHGVPWGRNYSDDAMQTNEWIDCGMQALGDQTMLVDQVSNGSLTDLYSIFDQDLMEKPATPDCNWADRTPGSSLPSGYNAKLLEMSNSTAGRAFYTSGVWGDGRAFALDEIDSGSPGTATWKEITPDILPSGSTLQSGQLNPDRFELRPNTVYYTTGIGRPSRALISGLRGQPGTWRDVTGSLVTDLPDADYWELVANPDNSNQMFLGTSVGMFRTDNANDPSPTWYRYMDGLPQVVNVMAVEINSHSQARPVVTIGTYGRGFYDREVRSASGGFIPGGPGQGDLPPLVVKKNPTKPGDIDLIWSESCSTGDDDYMVYEGVSQGNFTNHSPVTCSTAGATTWTLTPLANSATYYLIATVASLDQTPEQSVPGFDSSGAERLGGTHCYPLEVGACP